MPRIHQIQYESDIFLVSICFMFCIILLVIVHSEIFYCCEIFATPVFNYVILCGVESHSLRISALEKFAVIYGDNGSTPTRGNNSKKGSTAFWNATTEIEYSGNDFIITPLFILFLFYLNSLCPPAFPETTSQINYFQQKPFLWISPQNPIQCMGISTWYKLNFQGFS